MSLISRLRQHIVLIGLLLYAGIIRLLMILPHTIPFAFDHGKDSIAVLHMIKTLSLKFIGPWTSIPGLYFGPAWYYLLAPGYLLTNGNPVSGAVTMTILLLIQVVLAYKYFGRIEAVLVACAPYWFIISLSAWNPFPMTLVTWLILIALKKMKSKERPLGRWIFLMFFSASLGFHFSAAFAVFYVVILPSILLVKKVKITRRTVLYAVLAFVLPFIPQGLFEMKNGFMQTKAVIAYFSAGESQGFSSGKVVEVLNTTIGEMKLAVLPEITFTPVSKGVGFISLGLLIVMFVFAWHTYRKWSWWKEIGIYILVPLVGFFFLHFNVWYVAALMPVAVLVVGQVLRHAPKPLAALYLMLILLTPMSQYMRRLDERSQLAESNEMLPIKLAALDAVEEEAQGRPYASYHYVPDIYDYSYQYLYISRAFQGHALPTEFSYKPGEVIYIREKPDLLSKLPQTVRKPEVVFFLVEKASNQDFLQAWWGQQQYGTITEERRIGPNLTLYVATP